MSTCKRCSPFHCHMHSNGVQQEVFEHERESAGAPERVLAETFSLVREGRFPAQLGGSGPLRSQLVISTLVRFWRLLPSAPHCAGS